ncbi:hypothetical protein BaRGS_00030631 [Batillaria attramentaria]|uniref:Uncharacterized protein n=1 Tax=Batillaria attramentaria TaxID=370345 RepID=A0ABD0JTG9_9CAEN
MVIVYGRATAHAVSCTKLGHHGLPRGLLAVELLYAIGENTSSRFITSGSKVTLTFDADKLFSLCFCAIHKQTLNMVGFVKKIKTEAFEVRNL